jgi:putative FmdB family regulatory protein
MPTYEYTCIECDSTEDRVVAIDDRDKQRCEKCGYRLYRVLSFNGVVWAPTSGGHK